MHVVLHGGPNIKVDDCHPSEETDVKEMSQNSDPNTIPRVHILISPKSETVADGKEETVKESRQSKGSSRPSMNILNRPAQNVHGEEEEVKQCGDEEGGKVNF